MQDLHRFHNSRRGRDAINAVVTPRTAVRDAVDEEEDASTSSMSVSLAENLSQTHRASDDIAPDGEEDGREEQGKQDFKIPSLPPAPSGRKRARITGRGR